MKVITWNIRDGHDIDGAITVLGAQPRLQRADVIFLQEMDERGTAAVAGALGYHHVYAAASIDNRTKRSFGNAVLSQRPLDDSGVIELPHKALVGGRRRIALQATSSLGEWELTLCSTHLETPALARTKREEQVSILARAASRWSTPQALVGGDFNTASGRSVRALVSRFEAAGFAHVSVDATRTLRRVGQHFTLDHIFARGLAPIEAGVIRGVGVSDHAPVWVELEPGA